MTDEQINEAIAEACGWGEECVLNTDGDRIWVTKFPLYCTDLNAMHEAEKVLAPKNSNNFSENWWNYCKLLRGNDADDAIHATARQRAKAFLLTLGKWSATNKDSLIVGATTEQSSAVQSTSSGGSGGASTYGGKGLGIAGATWPPETRITVNGKTFCLADIDKEMIE